MDEENKIFSFARRHWSKLLLALLAIASIAVWTERLKNKGEVNNKQDYVTLQHIFENLHKGEHVTAETLEVAETILHHHPELRPKYDTLLALALLMRDHIDEGVVYAQSSIQRMDKELPQPYKEYALTSLLIAKKNYDQAYQNALALNEKIQGQTEYQILDGMNLLRIVFLAEMLGDHPKKIDFWQKLERHPSFAFFNELFIEGHVTLEDYIKRKI